MESTLPLHIKVDLDVDPYPVRITELIFSLSGINVYLEVLFKILNTSLAKKGRKTVFI